MSANAADELIGYVDQWNWAPGDAFEVKVSTTLESYEYDVVRLVQGDDNPAGPGVKVYDVPEAGSGTCPGGVQQTHPGSYAVIPSADAVRDDHDVVVLDVVVLPTWQAPGWQAIVSSLDPAGGSGFELALDPQGRFTVLAGAGERLTSVTAPRPASKRWYAVRAVIGGGRLELHVRQAGVHPGRRPDEDEQRESAPADGLVLASSGALLLAASRYEQEGDVVGRHFTGKLERPILRAGDGASDGSGSPSLLGDWDLARGIRGDRIEDVSGAGRHGRLVNAPTRAVTGSTWTGASLDWTRAPDEYAAIHFHADDVADAGWTAGFSVSLPETLRSGVYAVRLRAGELVDHVPFFVRPGRNQPRRRIAVLMSTFSYVAYGNEHMWNTESYHEIGAMENPVVPDPRDLLLQRHPEFGRAMYDLHCDGSGVCLASTRRPVLNMRHDYRTWQGAAPRNFAADLYIGDWLEARGHEYDVITDHDLHAEGVSLLESYEVVMTGSHPEYVSAIMLDALEEFTATGGRLMYLGGNGFYWVVTCQAERPHLMELRRGSQGARPWEGAPGEGYHAMTGEPGGLWRGRGRAPNRLVGVGMTGVGWDNQTPGYARTADSHDPSVAFMFDGIADDEIIGDFGLVLGGACGDEIDRADVALGTPPDALVVCTSTGHSSYYVIVPEELLTVVHQMDGPSSDKVRADMVYFETPGGGAVFSVGSISYTGCLASNRYDNNVSRLTDNVLRHFVATGRRAAATTGAGARGEEAGVPHVGRD